MDKMEFVPVSQVLNSLKEMLQTQFRMVYLMGEVSNLTKSSNGHYYFTLSDELGALSVVLFRTLSLSMPTLSSMKNGDKIFCAGNLTLYPKKGQLQLNAQYIHSSGMGVLKMRYEMLKKKLASQGYFDLERKKSLPKIPRKVVLITSPQGAAVHDFLNVYKNRCLQMDILIIPALMQGEKSSLSLQMALKKAQEIPNVDVIVFTRGGGSFEDLYSFNDEQLIEDIYHCPICVLSAIGHQVDFTLCDYVSDVRAQTPTMAAQMLTEYSCEILQKLAYLRSKLLSFSQNIQLYLKNILTKANPINMVIKLQQMSYQYNNKLQPLLHSLQHSINLTVQKYNLSLQKYEISLQNLDPKKIWQRGVAYVENSKGEVIRNCNEFNVDESPYYVLKFIDGSVYVQKKS